MAWILVSDSLDIMQEQRPWKTVLAPSIGSTLQTGRYWTHSFRWLWCYIKAFISFSNRNSFHYIVDKIIRYLYISILIVTKKILSHQQNSSFPVKKKTKRSLSPILNMDFLLLNTVCRFEVPISAEETNSKCQTDIWIWTQILKPCHKWRWEVLFQW